MKFTTGELSSPVFEGIEDSENIPSITSKSRENPLGSVASCPQTLSLPSLVKALGGNFDH